ncbi:MAG: SMC family ATPase [Frankia sp.]|nr:SMC family ATPase [Frankia sp.]
MRPVLLEMAGFGSFRDPAAIDFTDADYFALVGPTGSGKSTVIDAMTFALFGSVPRWDNRRTVSLALAPTVTRGTVRLVFDAAGQRYVVARELRRQSNGNVTVRNARLEKLADPAGTGARDEPPGEVLAADSQVSQAVEKLLGLTFEHFCTCVVLPQGDFAEFLHARPAERQKILTRLLGLGVYEEIRAKAAERASDSQRRAALLAEQLGEYQDATPAAEAAAADRVRALTELSGQVDAALAELATRAAAAREAATQLAAVTEERDRLAALRTPDDVAPLTTRLRAAYQAAVLAGERRQEAERADTAARAALAEAPERGPLERARRDHDELAQLDAGLPGLRAAHAAARSALAAATAAVTTARRARDDAAAARDRAGELAKQAGEEVARLRAEAGQLAAVRTPPGVAELASRLAAAQRALAEATERRQAAERADDEARAALASVPLPRATLERARRDHEALAALRPEIETATRAHATVAARRDEALAAAERARAQRDAAAEELERATRADLAASLRAHLVVGEPCPVCAHPVAAVPAHGHGADEPEGAAPRRARAALEEAQRVLQEREAAVQAAAQTEYEARVRLRGLRERGEELAAALAGLPGLPEVTAALAELDRLERAATQAGRELRSARSGAAQAEQAAARLTADGARARAQLAAVRDPLVALGAPTLDDADLAAAWAGLVEWAGGLARRRADELRTATAREAGAKEALRAAEQAYAAALATADQAERDQLRAVADEQAAAGRLANAQQRADQLRDALAGGPGADEVSAALAELDRLAQAARQADADLRAARKAADDADAEVRRAEQALGAARATLTTTRDALVPLGAPPLGGQDLLADWAALTDWAAGEAAARDARLPALRQAVAVAQESTAAARRELTELLAAHEIELPDVGGELADAAARAVTTALERARARHARVVERRAAAARLADQLADAREAQQVAAQLARLLRSDKFQRWLVAEALDTLVEDASRTLRELSGGQFDLSHEDGEFVIVDHADADSRRPVRTLSGGETFQASLSLALALSAQLSTLAAAGAARLDSIFLDEGFGTLDDATLDVVASTLENLASGAGTAAGGAGRMVGLVTHVRTLAERVPVRFAVSRDQRTSTVVRETT